MRTLLHRTWNCYGLVVLGLLSACSGEGGAESGGAVTMDAPARWQDRSGGVAQTPGVRGTGATTSATGPQVIPSGSKAPGADCTKDGDCASNICEDAVCCKTACGNSNAADCQACNQVGSEGTCKPLPTTHECRSAANDCDAPETCNGTQTTCPADVKKPDGAACAEDGNPCTVDACLNAKCGHVAGNKDAVCRAPASDCDLVEVCDGKATGCPGDVKKPDGTACTDEGNACTADQCKAGACGHVAGNKGATCRAAANECDVAEICDGKATACPADTFVKDGTACVSDNNPCTLDQCKAGGCAHPAGNSGTECRAAAGDCDLAEVCTGTSTTCPADVKRPNTYVCRAKNGNCDVAETCDGGSSCPADGYAPSTQQCRAPACSGGIATIAANCPGSSGTCPAIQNQTCSPYVCNGSACSTTCVVSTDCGTGSYCATGQCKPREAQGAPCTTNDGCVSGHCVDAVCCNVACASQCQACDVSGTVGTCTAVTGKPHGSRPGCTTDGSTCGGSCNGTVVTSCTYPGNTLQCRAASCNSDVAILPATCSGTGTCPALQTQACSPFTCSGTKCGGNCSTDTDCASGSFCSAGVCKAKLGVGQPCSANTSCGSSYCADGVCCTGPCTGQCEACNLANVVGTCTAVTGAPHGGRTPCATDGSTCGGTCNGTLTGTCSYPTAPCRASSCNNEVAVLAASCDGMGACPPEQTQNCAPFLCSGPKCGGSCVVDTDCGGLSYCSGGVCVVKPGLGFACGADNQCTSGYCTDGVCCAGGCVGQCEACDKGGAVGTCVPIVGAPHGARPQCTGDGSSCAGSCNGTVATGCAYPDGSVQCRAPSCDNNTATLASNCAGTGSCPAPQLQACAPFLCVGQSCAGDCIVDTSCAPGNFCAAGMCKAKIELGQPCGANHQCASAYCADGVCCDTECIGQCEACDVMGSLGICSPAVGSPHGGKPACAGVGVCQAWCDGIVLNACSFPGSTVECSAASCDNGVQQSAASCDGAGTCPAAVTKSCGNFACGTTVCESTCATADDCSNGLVCTGQQCVVPEAGPEAGPDASDAEPQDGPDAPLAESGTDAKLDAHGATDAISDATTEQSQAGDAATPSDVQGSKDEGGCGCATPGDRSPRSAVLLALLVAVGLVLRRKRR
jgi:MYXO-CTERM domain-containing protein